MRPFLLKGHERSLTQVKYNREGDLIFSAAKDKEASVWFSFNGERLGTFIGHEGTIWSLDVSSNSELLITGSADMSVKLWEVSNGKNVFTWSFDSPVRRVEFNSANNKFLAVTDAVMGSVGSIEVFEVNTDLASIGQQAVEPVLSIPNQDGAAGKATVAGFSYCGKYIISGHANGRINKYDGETGELLESEQVHDGLVTDLQFSQDRTYFITASKDKVSHILEVDGFKVIKTYETDAPLNTASITPVKNFVILGGGQEARDVTTTSSKEGKFEARFFHKIFQDEIGRVKGHFGPLNCIAVHPKGTGYASGGEDGYVRVHNFDKSYFEFKYDVEITAEASSSNIELEQN